MKTNTIILTVATITMMGLLDATAAFVETQGFSGLSTAFSATKALVLAATIFAFNRSRA